MSFSLNFKFMNEILHKKTIIALEISLNYRYLTLIEHYTNKERLSYYNSITLQTHYWIYLPSQA